MYENTGLWLTPMMSMSSIGQHQPVWVERRLQLPLQIARLRKSRSRAVPEGTVACLKKTVLLQWCSKPSNQVKLQLFGLLRLLWYYAHLCFILFDGGVCISLGFFYIAQTIFVLCRWWWWWPTQKICFSPESDVCNYVHTDLSDVYLYALIIEISRICAINSNKLMWFTQQTNPMNQTFGIRVGFIPLAGGLYLCYARIVFTSLLLDCFTMFISFYIININRIMCWLCRKPIHVLFFPTL